MGKEKVGNMVRARVAIVGIRPPLQHQFGPDAIPLEKQEKTGVAGNDPSEWRRTMMVTPEGQLYIRGDYVFSCLRDGAKHTKKGKGSIQAMLAATLQVEDDVILLDCHMPKEGDPPRDRFAPVYIDVCGVRNPSTKGRNVRYRLAASKGWKCEFTLLWDKTVFDRNQMKGVLRDAGILVGLADGRGIGNGRFVVESYIELDGEEEGESDAEEAASEGGVGPVAPDRVGKGRKKLQAVP